MPIQSLNVKLFDASLFAMRTIQKSASVPYSCEQMFGLVADVARYPEFVPWCKASQIVSVQEQDVEAALVIAQAGVEKTFTTRNHHIRPHRIELKLINGPFKKLEGMWRFTAQSEKSCIVHLDLQFEFASSIFAFAFAPIFTKAANTLVDAFIVRAREIYAAET